MSLGKLVQTATQEQEGLTKYKGVITSDHAYIHQGKGFTAVINVGTISAAYKIGFTTPTAAVNRHIHWRPASITTDTAYCLVELYEGDAFTEGTAVTPINRNRNSATVTAMQAFAKGVTVTPAGTRLAIVGVGTAGTPASSSGGGGGSEHELLLKPDTNYVVQITPSAGTDVTAELFWYDEPGYTA